MTVTLYTLMTFLWCKGPNPTVPGTCIIAGSTEAEHSVKVCGDMMFDNKNRHPTPNGYWACSFKSDKGPVYFRLTETK